MYPVICKIGPVSIYSYGLMLAVAVIVCACFMSRDARRYDISSDIVFDFIFWVVLGGLLGARWFFIVLHVDYFFKNPLEIIMIQNGGLAWQGGLILGIVAALLFIKKKNLELSRVADLVAPYIALGQSIGRVGCFLNGCCFGREVGWGIYFPIHDAHLHPTQLYASLGLLIIFFVLKYFQKIADIQGQVFILYLILASALRFDIEFFRADHYQLYLGLSIYQWVCAGLFFTAVYVHTRLKSRSR